MNKKKKQEHTPNLFCQIITTVQHYKQNGRKKNFTAFKLHNNDSTFYERDS